LVLGIYHGVFIESFHLDDEKYSRWVFIREGEAICDHAKEYADFSSKMEKYIDRISKRPVLIGLYLIFIRLGFLMPLYLKLQV
jgi:hypothetical protein